MAAPASESDQGGRDRLSDLPDGVIGHILSFLPTKEAARAAVLARSWRYKFAHVDAMSFVEHVANYGGDDFTFELEAVERRSKNADFIDDVNAALLCRRRCAGDRNVAPRAFRVHFGCFDEWDKAMVSQWLTHLLRRSAPELHLDLRLQLTVMGEHDVGALRGRAVSKTGDGCPAHSRYEADPFALPSRLFSCAALRTLCLGGCGLSPPEVTHLPLLETLLLSSISGRGCGDSIQRLISGCPRLVDLTLERCGYTIGRGSYYTTAGLDPSYTITVLDRRLRRLALRCCHNLTRVTVDASELRELEYRGAVPADPFLTMNNPRNLSSCHISFCKEVDVYRGDLPRLRKFLEQFMGATHLHLVSM